MHAFVRFMAVAAGLTLTVVCQAGAAPAVAPTPAVRPVNAVAAILDAFRTHSVVALDEEHTDERAHSFRLALIREPRFPLVVNDIVVEFGNSLHQNVLDRFVAGEQVADDTLRRIWQDTTQAHTIWDRPIYEEFFRAVRTVNAALPSGRRLRVLLGDPPIDWTKVSTPQELRNASAGRGSHPVDVIRREVMAKQRRALVVYGAIHLWRRNPLQPGPNLIERLEKETRTSAFVVVTHPFVNIRSLGVDPASWPVPSVVVTRGTALDSQMDAVLYLGPTSGRTSSLLTPALCADSRYRETRVTRMSLAGTVDPAAVLARECDAAQDQPLFSGRWKPVESAAPATPAPGTSPGGPPPPPRTLSITITQSATEMKVDRELETAGRTIVSTLTYKLDGTESVNQVGPVVFTTNAEWEGAALILSSVVTADEKPLGHLREVYRLKNGELVVETTRETPAGTFNGTTVHRRD
jgi:hypothetical protein